MSCLCYCIHPCHKCLIATFVGSLHKMCIHQHLYIAHIYLYMYIDIGISSYLILALASAPKIKLHSSSNCEQTHIFIYTQNRTKTVQMSSVGDHVFFLLKNMLMFEVILWYMTPKCHLMSAPPCSDNLIHSQSHLGHLNTHEWMKKHPVN